MDKQPKLTLIGLVVVILTITFVILIIIPAFNFTRTHHGSRVICATNLKGLGAAQTVYANDYDGDYALQGGRGSINILANETANWFDPERPWSNTTGGTLTVGASLYLLVREADVSPKSFVCPQSDQKEWDQITASKKTPNPPDIVEVWDFGSVNINDQGPENCVSYSYHQPYNNGSNPSQSGNAHRYAADDQRSASFAIMADRSPFFDRKLTLQKPAKAKDAPGLAWLLEKWDDSAEKWQIQVANAQPHDRESQNVLFADGHTSNEKRTDVGVRYDNIYTPWGTTTPQENDIRTGISGHPNYYGWGPEDSVLVNDGFWQSGE